MKEWIKNLGMGVTAAGLGAHLTVEATKAVEEYNKSLPKTEMSSQEIVTGKSSELPSESIAAYEEGLSK